jgi:hypothetical protein
MKKLLFVLLLVICCLRSNSQVGFSYSVGLGTYSLADIKNFQKALMEETSLLPVKAVNTFPPYLFFRGQVEFGLTDELFLGVDGGFYSTGGRNHLADYSGEYRFDMALRSIHAAGHIKYKMPWLTAKSKFSIFTRLTSGMMFSRFKTEESLHIYSLDPVNYNYTFKSKTFFLEPSFNLNYRFLRNVSASFDLGYEADLKSKLFVSDNKHLWLQFPSGKPVYLNMSGLRVSLGLSVEL